MTASPVAARWAVLPLSLLAAIGVALWAVFGLGGLGRKGSALFNWHPVLMSLAALVLLPQGMLIWSSYPEPLQDELRAYVKWCHAGLMTTGFVLTNVGIGIAYAAHVQQGIANFYSLHSWMGLAAIALLKSNLVGGLLSVFVPRWRIAQFSGNMHRLVGVGALVCISVSVVTGFAELQAFVVQRTSAFAVEALIGAVLGSLSVCVLMLIVLTMESGVTRVGRTLGMENGKTAGSDVSGEMLKVGDC